MSPLTTVRNWSTSVAAGSSAAKPNTLATVIAIPTEIASSGAARMAKTWGL
ncbi:MAG: hypothetical protein QM756_39990 [Polyangiaceae bacterium]